jgi:hypothetical protein
MIDKKIVIHFRFGSEFQCDSYISIFILFLDFLKIKMENSHRNNKCFFVIK